MAHAVVNFKIQPYRLLTKSQAASYCVRLPNIFESQCPVSPVLMPNGDKLWDVIDLDRWIDSLKGGSLVPSQEDFLERLG